MPIQRRQFLKLAGAAGLGLSLPIARRFAAAAGGYTGPYWVLVHAQGAWDPRCFVDPIGAGDQNRLYTGMGEANGIQFADYPVSLDGFGLDTTQGYESYLLSNAQFFGKHGQRFTVLNGIDTSTNNHEAGTRATWSGRLLGEYPAFGALVAAQHAADQPMAFISNGSYDVTGGLVPLARASNPDTLAGVAYPNLINPTDAEPESFHSASTQARLEAARRERFEALRTGASLPREQTALAELEAARLASGALAQLTLPDTFVDIPGYQLDDLERLMRAEEIALAAFQSGVCAAATVTLGGFDTHANHDREQPRQLAKLWYGLDYLFTRAEALGLADRLFVVVGSDFGRGPSYNSDNDNAGKDHWPITSMLVSGPGVPGGRVIGATSAGQQARKLDPGSLQPADDGVTLTPDRIHQSLRALAGLDAVAADFPLEGETLPLFD
jgi:uncharacterized protein (DUF1501 family)